VADSSAVEDVASCELELGSVEMVSAEEMSEVDVELSRVGLS
jgi:hypothetical protein